MDDDGVKNGVKNGDLRKVQHKFSRKKWKLWKELSSGGKEIASRKTKFGGSSFFYNSKWPF